MNCQAIQIDQAGGYDQLQLRTLTQPTSGPNVNLTDTTVTVEIRYTGINYADVCIRWGLYDSAKKFVGFPITPGFEFSGVIVGINKGTSKDAAATTLQVGQWVVGVSMFGAYSTHITVPHVQLLPFDPSKLSPEVAASLPCASLTAWYALFILSTPGQSPGGNEGKGKQRRILVHSAAGGVGSMICRLAKLKGMNTQVVGIVGSKKKVAKLKSWNCCDVIVSKEDCTERGIDFWSEVDQLSPGFFDAIFDANGPSTLTGSYDHLCQEGRLITYGFHSTLPKKGGTLSLCQWVRMAYDYYFVQKTFDAMDMVPQNKSVMGFNLSFLFARTDLYVEVMSRVLTYVENGDIQLNEKDITVYPLEDVAKAHAAIESGMTTGKLILCTENCLAKMK